MPGEHDMTASGAAAAVRSGEVSAEELLAALLDRSALLEPQLGLWATLDGDYAMAQARERDGQIAAGRPPGPLCGVPVGVKDIYDTAGLLTAHGSPLFAGNVPARDAASVERLKRAGAVIMGKTVTTEFACGDPPATRNPWRADRTPGGSSTGSAVGTAARVFPLALGSQTAGSVLRPAAYNAVVGLKPTMGRISRRGVMPVSWSVDTLGTFTRTVADAALALSVLSGNDPEDPFCLNSPPTAISPRVPSAGGLRLGLLRTFFLERSDPDASRCAERVAEMLEAEGARVEELTPDLGIDALQAAHRTVMNVGAAAVHERLFAQHPDAYSPDVRRTVEIGLLTPSVTYMQAERLRRSFRRKLLAAIAPYDAVLTTTTREAGAPGTATTGDPRWQAPMTTAGLPAVSLPAELSTDGMPMGVQVIAGPMCDERLLAIAGWIESVIGFDHSPPLDLAHRPSR